MNRGKSGRAAMFAAVYAAMFASAALPAAAADWTLSGRYQYFSETALGGQGANGCQDQATPLPSGDCRADPASGWAVNFTASMAAADADEAAAACVPGYPGACRATGYAIDGRGVAAGEYFEPARDLPRPCVAGAYAVGYSIVRRANPDADAGTGGQAIESEYRADEFRCR